jgi:hypothetical protein
VPVEITEKSSSGGTLTLNFKQIVRAEPDAALFTVPSDYTRFEVNLPAPESSPVVTKQVTTVVRKP